jgi:hypothetical protein
MLYDIMPGQVFEIDFEIAAAHEGAHNTQHGGQRQGEVIVFPHGTDKLESGNVTSIMWAGE